MPTVEIIAPEREREIVDVLCDAFHEYPVMRFVLGSAGDYDARLRTLVGFFVAARLLRGEPMLGIESADGCLAGVAILSLPGERPAPTALLERRELVWRELGEAERRRYEAYGNACLQFRIIEPHHHLNMIGVRSSQAGTGLGRELLEAVFALALADPGSSGVSLDTEKSENVRLYEHCGWKVVARARVAPELETWGMFRGKRFSTRRG